MSIPETKACGLTDAYSRIWKPKGVDDPDRFDNSDNCQLCDRLDSSLRFRLLATLFPFLHPDALFQL